MEPPAFADVPVTITWRRGIGLGMSVADQLGPQNLPLICDGKNFPSRTLPGKCLREGAGAATGKGEKVKVLISEAELLSRLLLTGNHMLTMCGELVAVPHENGTSTSRIIEILNAQTPEFGDTAPIPIVVRMFRKTSKKRKRAEDDESDDIVKISPETTGIVLERARSLVVDVYRSQIGRLHKIVQKSQESHATMATKTSVETAEASSEASGEGPAAEAGEAAAADAPEAAPSSSTATSTTASSTTSSVARFSEKQLKRQIARSFRPSKLEKKLARLLRLDRGTLRRKFAGDFVELMKDARTDEQRCLMLLSVGSIRRLPKMQQKLLASGFFAQLCAWGQGTIRTMTPWVDVAHAPSSRVGTAHDLCIKILAFLERVEYVKELAKKVQAFIVDCEENKTSSSVQDALQAVVNAWKAQRTALKEAKAEAKRQGLLKKAEMAKKEAVAAAAKEKAAAEAAITKAAAGKKKNRKRDALGDAFASPANSKRRKTTASSTDGGTDDEPSGPSISVALPEIQSFQSARKNVRDGHSVRFMELSPDKRIFSSGTAHLPQPEREAFKARTAHILVGCTDFLLYVGEDREQHARSNNIQDDRRMLSEGLAEMDRIISWRSPRDIGIPGVHRAGATAPNVATSFAGRCAALMNKGPPVRLYRKGIAPEAPPVRIMKGFRQPPAGKKVPPMLVGTAFVAVAHAAAASCSSSSASTSAAMAMAPASAHVAAPATVPAILPPRLPQFFDVLKKDPVLLQELAECIKDPDGTELSNNEDFERRLQMLQVIPEIALAINGAQRYGEPHLKAGIRAFLAHKGASPYAEIAPQFFSLLSAAWQNHILSGSLPHQSGAQSHYQQQQQQYPSVHQQPGHYQQPLPQHHQQQQQYQQQQYHQQQLQQQYQPQQPPQRQRWQPGRQYSQ